MRPNRTLLLLLQSVSIQEDDRIPPTLCMYKMYKRRRRSGPQNCHWNFIHLQEHIDDAWWYSMRLDTPWSTWSNSYDVFLKMRPNRTLLLLLQSVSIQEDDRIPPTLCMYKMYKRRRRSGPQNCHWNFIHLQEHIDDAWWYSMILDTPWSTWSNS